MKRKILFTGGTGFIGRHFIAEYSDYQYTLLSRNPDKAKKILPEETDFITSLDDLNSLDDFDVVINLAGEPIIDRRWTIRQKRKIEQSRWETTSKLVELIEASSKPPELMISGSAIGIYGNTDDSPVDEDSPIDHSAAKLSSDFSHQLCYQWEQLALKAKDKTRLVIPRTGIVLDSRGGALQKMLLPFKCYLGAQLGEGKQWFSWIHLTDMISALHFFIDNSDCQGVYNMTAPESVTNQNWTQSLAKALGRKAFLKVPAFGLKILMGESSQLLLDSQRIQPKRLLQAGYKFKHPQLESALVDLVGKK